MTALLVIAAFAAGWFLGRWRLRQERAWHRRLAAETARLRGRWRPPAPLPYDCGARGPSRRIP